jgi:hypothetical protein
MKTYPSKHPRIVAACFVILSLVTLPIVTYALLNDDSISETGAALFFVSLAPLFFIFPLLALFNMFLALRIILSTQNLLTRSLVMLIMLSEIAFVLKFVFFWRTF